MTITKLTIVPVTLDPINHKESLVVDSSQYSSGPSCIIQTAGTQISFFNGVDECIHPNDHKGVEQAMKHDFTSVQNIYIICGKPDMRNYEN